MGCIELQGVRREGGVLGTGDGGAGGSGAGPKPMRKDGCWAEGFWWLRRSGLQRRREIRQRRLLGRLSRLRCGRLGNRGRRTLRRWASGRRGQACRCGRRAASAGRPAPPTGARPLPDGTSPHAWPGGCSRPRPPGQSPGTGRRRGSGLSLAPCDTLRAARSSARDSRPGAGSRRGAGPRAWNGKRRARR